MKSLKAPVNNYPIYPVLTYKEFYGIKPPDNDPIELVRQYDFEDILMTLILINNDAEGRIGDEHYVMKVFIGRLPTWKSLRLQSYIQRKGEDKFLITNSTVITRLISDLFGLLPQTNNFKSASELDFEEALFDLVLIYNERQYPVVGVGTSMQSHEMMWRLMLMQDLTGLTNIHYARNANIKHTLFIKFLRQALGDRFEEMEADFKERTGMDGIYTPVITLLNLFIAIENKFRESGTIFITIERNESIYSFLQNFQLLFNIRSVEGRQGEIGYYITHPFFENTNGRIYLMDHNNFAFAVDRGWFFFLYRHSNLHKLLPGANSFEGFLGYLGKHYFEVFLITGMLCKLNRPGCRVLQSDDNTRPDATIILNEKEVFMIEIKSHALHLNVINKMDLMGFKDFIDSNFASPKKGAGQLARLVLEFGNNTKDSFSIKQPKSKLTIYPVVIYTEQHLKKNAVNDYVAEKFEKAITESKHMFKEIKPLVMIHYDFFIENISLFERKPSLFKIIIEDYLQYVRNKKSLFKKTGHNMDYLLSMISFDNFVVKKQYQELSQLDQIDIFKNLARLFDLKDDE